MNFKKPYHADQPDAYMASESGHREKPAPVIELKW